MKKSGRKRANDKRKVDRLEDLQHALLGLHDELSETMAWTAFVCDGLCGVLAERPTDIDCATHNGIRFAAMWLKQRNEKHGAALQAACKRLREIRGR